MPQSVLVTGAAGRIGRAVVGELTARGHRVRAFDRHAAPRATESIVGDIGDAAAICAAATGVDSIVHLAATPDDADFMTELLPNNVIGAYQVFEAARLAGVPRIVLASTGQVVWWQRFTGPLPIKAEDAPSPRGWYAATKLFQEAAGRSFAEKHGMCVIVVRLGWVPRDRAHAEELARTSWGPDVYLSPADAGRFFACAIEADVGQRFSIVYACSRPVQQSYYDQEPAQKLGYDPRDTWPEGTQAID